ncbi:zinc finger protein 521-like isoform X2 [Rhopalosiphum padi]|uniref:zinc finger protein 521-like isoform X2 n=1 Tax=Rhopalosiphum padi TaxID=40932 RepID=UPI00298E5C0F|nr:zinc finger protein 521-like isoform X2 [Rhopalosiphum padi]
MSFLNDDTPRRLHSQMNICRICLKYNTNDNPFFDVFTDKLQCLNIYDVLKNLFDINVEPGDLRPKYICQHCYNKVSEWLDFVLKAHYSQFCINEMIYDAQPITSPSSSVINIPNDDNQDNSNNNSSTSSNSPSPSVISIPDDDNQDNSDNYSSTFPAPINNLSNNEDNQENSYCMPSTSTADIYIIKKKINLIPYGFYSCIIRSCKKSFKTFQGFKTHYRRHRNVADAVMCWKCNNTFPNKSTMHSHQMKRECVVFPGMFGCLSCPESFDDLQSLSIHKYNMHIVQN